MPSAFFSKAPTWLFVILFAASIPGVIRAQSPIEPIGLSVDLREAPRRIFHARLDIPVTQGPLALFYPKWIPGEHGPTGPIQNLTGLKFSVGGKPVAWRRDDVDMFVFHCEVPAGARTLEVELDYVSPTDKGNRAGRGPASTEKLAVLNWNQVLLYPAGKSSDELRYAASLRLPVGWKFAVALPVSKQSGDSVEFAPVSLTMLVDSPLLAGAHFRSVPLPLADGPPHELDLAGDSPASIQLSPALERNFTQLVAEAAGLFGAHHYNRYRFLLALSDNVRPSGLEHHESSDNRLPERSLLDDDERKLGAGLLPHEFVHSWNAKYRRPAGLTTPDYHQPMKGELLWVYEGLTEYLGVVLTARSGLLAPAEWREDLARVAAYLDHRPGRTWRSLSDTAVAAQILYGAPQEWAAWRRGVDFYDESTLIWLEADVLIRQLTRGQRSLDDFCRHFYGGRSGPPEVKPYSLDELVAAMNQIAPYDWKKFFSERLESTGPGAPLGGLEASGWRLVYTEAPNDLIRAHESANDAADFTYSLGFRVRRKPRDENDGRILDAIPGMPAAQAGLAPGMKLVAVNGRRWSPAVLREALRGAQGGTGPIKLLVENADYYATFVVDYHGGDRHPHLERDSSRPDLLSEIILPRSAR